MNKVVQPYVKWSERKKLPKTKKKGKKKKVLFTLATIILIIVLCFVLFPVQIASFFLSLFMDTAPLTTPDSAASLFESIDVYQDNPIALEGYEIIPVNHNSLSFSGDSSTSISDAASLVALAMANLEKMEKWGIFMDIYSEDNTVGSGALEGIGTIATQFVKIQDGDNFFLNEGFALIEFEFLSLSNSYLAEVLRGEINGGCRILTHTDNDRKYVQWVPKNGASYDPETKLISTALLDIRVKTLSEEEEHEAYDRDRVFEDLLPLDITVDTINSASITHNEAAKVYTVEVDLNAEKINENQISAGVIRSLFGEDLAQDIIFNESTFIIEIWENGLFKSIRGTQDWSANLTVEFGATMRLATYAPATRTDFYFSYSDEDCSVASIIEKYYADAPEVD